MFVFHILLLLCLYFIYDTTMFVFHILLLLCLYVIYYYCYYVCISYTTTTVFVQLLLLCLYFIYYYYCVCISYTTATVFVFHILLLLCLYFTGQYLVTRFPQWAYQPLQPQILSNRYDIYGKNYHDVKINVFNKEMTTLMKELRKKIGDNGDSNDDEYIERKLTNLMLYTGTSIFNVIFCCYRH